MKKILLNALPLFIIYFFTTEAHAQNFGLVKDINNSKDGSPVNNINNLYLDLGNLFAVGGVTNGKFVVFNGIAYFTADDGVHGTELWRSDNTVGGTYMVKDISAANASSQIQSLTVAGNKLYFIVNNILWMTDGTEAGTLQVPGVSYTGDITTCLTPAGNVLYFLTNVSRIWKTDGTVAGTSLIIDFRQTYSTIDFIGQLTNVNGTLFFTTGVDYTSGAELWKSDGTAQGAVLVKDINPGKNDSRPTNLTLLNGKLYFSANDGAGVHLWVSDGTANGTQPVTNTIGATLLQDFINSSFNITPFTVVKKVLYFKANTSANGDELFKYDPAKSSAGIMLVKDIIAGSVGSFPANLTAVKDTLYFSVSGLSGDQQLWKSTGTKAGTHLVKSTGIGNPQNLSNFVDANGQLFFSCFTPDKGYELWSSDGTASGTGIVKDIFTGTHGSAPGIVTYYKNGISLFSATDGVKGIELWRTDGTNTGTSLVKNINNTTTAGSNLNLYGSVSLNNKLYFAADDPLYGNSLYISDGTSAGTHLIKDINNGNSSSPNNFAVFKNEVYFSADSAGYKSVYKTDGTAAGTIQIFNAGKTNISVQKIVAATKYLYVFYYDDDNSTSQLWVTDGTTSGSHKIQDIEPFNFIAATVGNTLYFGATDSTHETELWKATHTSGSAKLVKDIYPGTQSSYPNAFLSFNNKLYFQAQDSANTSYLYVSDGTKAGTQRVFLCSSIPQLVQARDKIFFRSYDANAGTEPYISDGTTNGTKLLKDIFKGINGSSPFYFTVMDSTVYFQAIDSAHGFELWKSDGTKNGTVLVKDINPGTNGSYPYRFTVAHNQLYFFAYDESFITRLFVSNGKTTGTYAIDDAGLQGVNISDFIGGGKNLFLNGYTYSLGIELYAGYATTPSPQINNVSINNAQKNNQFTAFVIGNPVQDGVKLAVNANEAQKVQIVISDASGKILINKSESLSKRLNMFSYSAQSWSQGIYALKIIAADNSVVMLKIVK